MIRVLIVDDSPLVRRIASDILQKDPMIKVIGTAPNGEIALKKIDMLNPDVVTMDVEMPGMGGLRAIREIMVKKPTPIIVMSAYVKRGVDLTLEALELGAVDFIAKPESSLSGGIESIGIELRNKVKNASNIKVENINPSKNKSHTSINENNLRKEKIAQIENEARYGIVAIGASTGGPKAIKELLISIPENFPGGIVVVQHMPPLFTKSFADRLNSICRVSVKEASDGDPIKPGQVLIAPGDFHMTVTNHGMIPRILLHKWSPVSGHRPSVDVLMHSVAREFGEEAIGVIMTGMGKDGAEGIAELRRKGGYVIAQDEKTSVIYGMNKEVIKNGDYNEILPIEKIAFRITDLIAEGKTLKEAGKSYL